MACCARGELSIAATACGAERLDAGRAPRRPGPVPGRAGCGGISSALATSEPDVSAASERVGGMALVTGGAGCAGDADASFICPALTWTVLTRTGFIGSEEPGMANAAAALPPPQAKPEPAP